MYKIIYMSRISRGRLCAGKPLACVRFPLKTGDHLPSSDSPPRPSHCFFLVQLSSDFCTSCIILNSHHPSLSLLSFFCSSLATMSSRGTLIPEWFHLQEVTTTDLVLASLAWGFTLGMGWITTWTAIQQTLSAYRRLGWTMVHNAYIWMIWGEITASLGFGILTYLHLFGIIRPR